MERLFELGMLLDRYEPLLTERQRSILRQYTDENCSLSEIAEREGISRQGVRDIIARGSNLLHETEAAVGLVRKEARQTAILRAFRGRFKDAPMRDEDRAAFETYLSELAGIWEDEDGI
jgi:predicted DNA-binding protein YlxM (UPF0122 family)